MDTLRTDDEIRNILQTAPVRFDEQQPDAPAENPFTRAVLLSVTFRRPGIRRKANLGNVTTAADKDLLSLSKDIIDSPELVAIKQHDGLITKDLRRVALPSQFKAGTYLIPVPLVNETDDKLQARIRDRAPLIEAFLAAYPQRVEEAQSRLADQFDAANYPSVERLRSAFGIETRLFTFAAPGNIQGIKREIFEREAGAAREWWAEAKQAAQGVLRDTLVELVEHLRERLTGEREGGKAKKLATTTVENLLDFLDTFEDRNLIASDRDLQVVVQQAKRLLTGVDLKELRTDAGVRERVRVGLDALKAEIAPLITDAPSRRIDLGEEE